MGKIGKRENEREREKNYDFLRLVMKEKRRKKTKVFRVKEYQRMALMETPSLLTTVQDRQGFAKIVTYLQ